MPKNNLIHSDYTARRRWRPPSIPARPPRQRLEDLSSLVSPGYTQNPKHTNQDLLGRCAFTPALRRQEQADVQLDATVSSRTARATTLKPCLGRQLRKNKNTGSEFKTCKWPPEWLPRDCQHLCSLVPMVEKDVKYTRRNKSMDSWDV